MNHYPHHIGDYLKDTAHLDPVEDGIYRRMIDLYYTQEGSLTNDFDRLCRRLRVDPDKHGAVVRSLLDEFFKPTETGWFQERCERELSEYKDRIETARENGRRGGRPKKNPNNPTLSDAETKPFLLGSEKITQTKANQNQNHNHINKRDALSCPKDVEEKTWADFLTLRTLKKAPLTQTALDGLRTEAQKAGLSLDAALRECCSRGWQGFKASWMDKVQEVKPRRVAL